MKFANLHLHSTYSDAELSPRQLVRIAKAGKTEYQLRIHRRIKWHRTLEERCIAPEHGEIIPAPGNQLRVIAAPGRKIRKDVRECAAVAEFLFGDARHLLDMLVQLFIEFGTNQRAECIHHLKIPVYTAGADLHDLVGHTMVGIIAALIPFQIKYDHMAALAADK